MTLKAFVCGALGGLNGAACMTVLRLAARRAGVIQTMPPQALLDRSLGPPRGVVDRHIADHALHLGIGVLGGLGYGALARLAGRSPGVNGLVFGFAFWMFGFSVVLPLLGATRPPWRLRLGENAVNIAAHLVYGSATALVSEELSRQPRRAAALVPRAARTG